jgi:osmotically-inducible protein OsmY
MNWHSREPEPRQDLRGSRQGQFEPEPRRRWMEGGGEGGRQMQREERYGYGPGRQSGGGEWYGPREEYQGYGQEHQVYGQRRYAYPERGREDFGRSEYSGWSGESYRDAPSFGGGMGPHEQSWNARQGMGGFEQGRGTMAGRHYGKGPRGYKRSDDRLREEISDRLMQHPQIDASEIEVVVKDGDVLLKGTVEDRYVKRMIEDIAEGVLGVKDVTNQVRVRGRESSESEDESSTENRQEGTAKRQSQQHR